MLLSCYIYIFTILQFILWRGFGFVRDMLLLFFSFIENYGTNSIFIDYYLLPVVVIPFHLSTASTYNTCLYWFVKYWLIYKLFKIKPNKYRPNQYQLLYKLFKIKRNKILPTNGSYGTWLSCYHHIPCCQQVCWNIR